MKVVSWNIERGYKAQEIIAQLKQLDADVYLLYELDRNAQRTDNIDMFDLIQKALGISGKYVTEFDQIDRNSGETGNAIFSRYPIKQYSSVALPQERPRLRRPDTWLYSLCLQSRSGARQAQIFTITPEGKSLTLAALHLELLCSGWKHRQTQLESSLKGITPDIIAGDFNNVQGSLVSVLTAKPHTNHEVSKVRAWLTAQKLHDPFSDSQTTAGRFGIHAKIDWLASSSRLRVISSQDVKTTASDHNYLVVKYDIL